MSKDLSLTINPTVTPVPWGPLVLASYLAAQALAPISTRFDIDAKSTSLTVSNEGDAITQPLEILQVIAAHAGVAGDSTKVRVFDLVILRSIC